jgi:PAS domain-containing protein
MGRKSSQQTPSAISDDPTDKSEGTESYFLQPTRHDIIPIILMFVCIALGLTSGLLSYFLLGYRDKQTAINALNLTTSSTIGAFGNTFSSSLRYIESATLFFQLSKTPVTLYDQFEPFMYGYYNRFPKYLTTISYLALVPYDQVNAFVANQRAQGGIYSNLTITGRDAENKPIPPIYSPLRAIIMQCVPVSNMPILLGYDVTTNAVKNGTVYQAIQNRVPSVSGRTPIASLGPDSIAVAVNIAIFNETTGVATGMIGSTILLNTLVNESIASIPSGTPLYLSIMDNNATSSDPYNGFIYSTYTNPDGSFPTPQQNLDLINNAPMIMSQNIDFGDRSLNITLIATPEYMNQFISQDRWIGLFVSLALGLILASACVFWIFGRKLYDSRNARKSAGIQIDILKSNQIALRTLLDRIAVQEQKTRSVINSLPDFVCVISSTGKILQTNTAFDNEFPFTQQEMEKGVYTYQVFTELANDFFRISNEHQEFNTIATRRFGDNIEVSVRVRALKDTSDQSSSSITKEEKNTKLSSSAIPLPDLDEAYVIIAKNISHRYVTPEIPNEDKIQRNEFERKYRDQKFREEIRKFCEKNKNAENIHFLNQLKEYKKASFGDRVELKQQIFNNFIREGAPMQLNLANEVVVEETIKINKSMGDIDIFKHVEDCVIKILARDIYPRFVQEQKQSQEELENDCHLD